MTLDALQRFRREVKSHYFFNRYYSTNSVCMPKLFASHDDPAWPMATFFILLNLSAFLFILMVYIIIVVKSNATLQGGDHYNSRDISSKENKSCQSFAFWGERKLEKLMNNIYVDICGYMIDTERS